MVYDFIATFVLSLFVNVLVTKPLTNVLDLFMKKRNNRELFDDNNNLVINTNGKPGGEDTKDNDEVIILTNVAFDDKILSGNQLKDVSFLQNIENNCEKDLSVKM